MTNYQTFPNLYMFSLRGVTFPEIQGWRELLDGVSFQEVNDSTILFYCEGDPMNEFQGIADRLPKDSFAVGSGMAEPILLRSSFRSNPDIESWLSEHRVR